MPQLDVSTYLPQLFWLGICFALLCLIMVRFFIPKFANILEMREKKMREDLDKAIALKSEIARMEADNNAVLATARAEAMQILQHTLDTIADYKTRQLRDFEEELTQKSKEAQEMLIQEKQALMGNISDLVTKATVTVASKLLDQPLKAREVKAAVDQVMKKKSA